MVQNCHALKEMLTKLFSKSAMALDMEMEMSCHVVHHLINVTLTRGIVIQTANVEATWYVEQITVHHLFQQMLTVVNLVSR